MFIQREDLEMKTFGLLNMNDTVVPDTDEDGEVVCPFERRAINVTQGASDGTCNAEGALWARAFNGHARFHQDDEQAIIGGRRSREDEDGEAEVLPGLFGDRSLLNQSVSLYEDDSFGALV